MSDRIVDKARCIIKPIVEEITEKSVNTYISKYFS